MIKEHLIKTIKNTEWYRQATESRMFYIGTPAIGVTDEYGPPAIFSVIDDVFEGYYVKETLVKQAAEFLEKTKKEMKSVDDYYSRLKKVLIKLNNVFKEIDKNNLDNLDEKELLKLLKKLDDLTYDFWYVNWMCDKFDPEGHEMLKDEINNANVKLTAEEIEALTLPRELNFMDYSELELYKLAKKLKEKKFSDRELIENLKDYSKKYFYVQNSWFVVKVLKEKDFLPVLKKTMDEPADRINKRIKESGNKKINLDKKSEDIIKRKNVKKELQNVFYTYRKLAEIRDVRKEYVLKSNYYYYKLGYGLAKIYRIDAELMLRAVPREIIKGIDIDKFKETLKRRKKALFVIDKNESYILDGEDAEKGIELLRKQVLDKYTEIKGFCASKGKVEGTIKIVCGHAHFSKFKDGDILVAPMTRPEYVPLMKKAKAIITDEGGLTSHAAIISREIGKPCVVGTQVATHKLADGDNVLVDADNGIIKIIKKK